MRKEQIEAEWFRTYRGYRFSLNVETFRTNKAFAPDIFTYRVSEIRPFNQYVGIECNYLVREENGVFQCHLGIRDMKHENYWGTENTRDWPIFDLFFGRENWQKFILEVAALEATGFHEKKAREWNAVPDVYALAAMLDCEDVVTNVTMDSNKNGVILCESESNHVVCVKIIRKGYVALFRAGDHEAAVMAISQAVDWLRIFNADGHTRFFSEMPIIPIHP